jgi:hypothetical protein
LNPNKLCFHCTGMPSSPPKLPIQNCLSKINAGTTLHVLRKCHTTMVSQAQALRYDITDLLRKKVLAIMVAKRRGTGYMPFFQTVLTCL